MNNPHAYRVYLTLSGASTLFNAMMFTVLTVYYVSVGGLNPLQLVLVGSIMELTEFIFEIPTGIVADTYSRRLSVIIGTLLTGAAFVFIGSVNTFPLLALGSALYGLGSTFLSGAREAWIVDEVGIEHVQHVFLRTTQIRRLAALIGTLLSVGFANLHLSLPIVLGGSLTVLLGLYLMFVMPETGFQPRPYTMHKPMHSLHTGLSDSLGLTRLPMVRWFLAIAIVFGIYSEAFDRLGDAHFLLNFMLPRIGNLEPVVWFGIIHAGAQVLGFVVAGAATHKRFVPTPTAPVHFLVVLQVLWIISVVTFALAPSFALALAAYWTVAVISTIHGPIYSTWVNQYLESPTRATALSLLNHADAFGQLAGGPAIGVVGTVFSLRVALLIAGLVLSPVLLLYTQALRTVQHEPIV